MGEMLRKLIVIIPINLVDAPGTREREEGRLTSSSRKTTIAI